MELKGKILEQLRELQKESIADMVNFDVKDEWSNDLVETAEANMKKKGSDFSSIRKWKDQSCLEKISTYFLADNIFDCDVALRSMIIYWLAFFPYKGWTICNQKIESEKGSQNESYTKKFCMRNNGFELRGDTMNSFATPVLSLFRADHVLDKIKSKSTLQVLEDRYFTERYQQFDKKNTGSKIVWSAYILDQYKDFLRIFEEMGQSQTLVNEYIRLTHTIGNLTPMPDKCNKPRGNAFGIIKDYWDRTLLCIYFHYFPRRIRETKDADFTAYQNPLQKAFKNGSSNAREWLNSFGEGQSGWNTFVELNFMQDFVNVDLDGNYGMPKEFWPGHFKGKVMPSYVEVDEYKQFFTNTCAMITARGVRIAIAVKNALKDADLESLASKMVEEQKD